jgi:formate hydrogenlyase transcriptional activator
MQDSIVVVLETGGDMQATAARYESLVRVSEALRAYHDVNELFRSLARELHPVVHFSFLGLALYDEQTGTVAPHVLEASGDPAPPPTLTSDEQLTYWVIQHQKPLVIPSVEHETRFAQEMAYLRGQGALSVCCLPLATPQRRVGMLLAGSRQPYVYAEGDVTFLSLVANQVALAIDDATNFGALQASLALEQERTATFALLDELLSTLTNSLDIRVVFQQVSAIARKVIAHDMMSLPLLSDDRQHVVVHAVTGSEVSFPTTVPLPGHNKWMLTEPWEHLIHPDIQTDPLEKATPPGLAGYRGRMVIPIRLQSELVGALDFLSFSPDVYSKADALVGRRIADHVALTLSHQRLAEEAQRVTEARERASLLERRVTALTEEVAALGGHRRVVGESQPWKHVLKQATQVAATDTTVLLLGESGTGKEVVARFIHRASARSGGPFIAINCAALPEQLLESELFGHERGAFTGALSSKPGQLELAASGVLFLDEVSEMSPTAQAKFLRVLQEREFQRLGGTRVLKTNVRVIAATNRDVPAAIARGTFREDLYYRLNVFEIALPPLRERRDDVLPLSQAFLDDVGKSLGRPPAGVSREARQQLVDYHWPGNVRQLRNTLERAAILCEGGLITSEHLSLPAPASTRAPSVAAAVPAVEAPAVADEASSTDLKTMERLAIQKALLESKHNKSKTARLLGLTRTQLYVRLRKYGLE